jgi:Protein of unknown function (DUF2637)
MSSHTDKLLRGLTALTVAGLAVVAGAISFSHMRELALHHDQLGWKSYAFPVSVDGLEIVASLYLVAQRRAGRPTGWVPWAALVVGTLASLAANIAVGGSDIIGKALAGWPALSMLAAVKLLFSMIDHPAVDQRTAVVDDRRPSADRPAVPGTVPGTDRDGGPSSGTVQAHRTDDSGAPTDIAAEGLAEPALGHPAVDRKAQVDTREVAHLIPVARAARAGLASDGRSLSRDNLADRMRDDGHGVSNARAGVLVRLLRAEEDAAPQVPPLVVAVSGDPGVAR